MTCSEALSDSAAIYLQHLQSVAHLMEAVALFISRHFKLDKGNQPTKVRDRHCGTQFFKSRGIYLVLNNLQ